MNFFEHQDRARKKTGHLLILFLLAVAGIIVALYIIFSLGFYGTLAFDPALLGTVSVGTVGLISLGSATRMASLASGGAAVASSLGGRPVSTATSDPKERRLLNVVEEMAIAAGTPVPEVFVLDDPSINAFAAGQTPTNSVIGVTRGTMNLLSRDELQGVIAHEFSHILNGDTRLNMRLIGILHGILLLSIAGRLLLESQRYARITTSRDDSRGNPAIVLLLIGLGIYIVGSVGVFFASLIKSAVSRQREFLADASAVQFTRNPDGIAGALKKIGGLVFGSKVEGSTVDEASHLFFSNALSGSMLQLFATHPPLEARIKAIDPSFDGDFSKFALNEETVRGIFQSGAPMESAAGFAPAVPGPRTPHRAEDVPDSAGRVTQPHINYASGSRVSWPAELTRATTELFEAAAAAVSLVLSQRPHLQKEQLAIAAEIFGEPFADAVLRLNASTRALPVDQRLPFVDALIPVLKTMSESQARALAECVGRIVESDGSLSLFEFTLQHILLRQLDLQFRNRDEGIRFHHARDVQREITILLTALAALDSESEEALRRAFAAGMAVFSPAADRILPAPEDLRRLSEIDDALDRLALASPRLKRQIVLAASKVVFTDKEISIAESELLRAISETLDCPIPPFITAHG